MSESRCPTCGSDHVDRWVRVPDPEFLWLGGRGRPSLEVCRWCANPERELEAELLEVIAFTRRLIDAGALSEDGWRRLRSDDGLGVVIDGPGAVCRVRLMDRYHQSPETLGSLVAWIEDSEIGRVGIDYLEVVESAEQPDPRRV